MNIVEFNKIQGCSDWSKIFFCTFTSLSFPLWLASFSLSSSSSLSLSFSEILLFWNLWFYFFLWAVLIEMWFKKIKRKKSYILVHFFFSLTQMKYHFVLISDTLFILSSNYNLRLLLYSLLYQIYLYMSHKQNFSRDERRSCFTFFFYITSSLLPCFNLISSR